jgi:hypothetical protein
VTSLAAGAVGAAALLLVVAGAGKVADPTRTVGALRALRVRRGPALPSSPLLVRAGAAGELVLGAATLVYGGRVLPLLVAASYLGFAAFVAAALRSGTPVGTCGCFGRADTPPRPVHVLLDALLAAGAVAAAATGAPALVGASWVAWVTAAALSAWFLAAFVAPWPGRQATDDRRERRSAGGVPPQA